MQEMLHAFDYEILGYLRLLLIIAVGFVECAQWDARPPARSRALALVETQGDPREHGHALAEVLLRDVLDDAQWQFREHVRGGHRDDRDRALPPFVVDEHDERHADDRGEHHDDERRFEDDADAADEESAYHRKRARPDASGAERLRDERHAGERDAEADGVRVDERREHEQRHAGGQQHGKCGTAEIVQSEQRPQTPQAGHEPGDREGVEHLERDDVVRTEDESNQYVPEHRAGLERIIREIGVWMWRIMRSCRTYC
ncbi:hypothetical protein [Bifidobacterium pseudolongum]|uniref:hypothetical protein n=1 Tax=Bifidobacterium pseudolongum TaxID=1694 RepID=UPI0022E4E346|nr:hypothetical protein [Bifidobacterium pseudolongum]